MLSGRQYDTIRQTVVVLVSLLLLLRPGVEMQADNELIKRFWHVGIISNLVLLLFACNLWCQVTHLNCVHILTDLKIFWFKLTTLHQKDVCHAQNTKMSQILS